MTEPIERFTVESLLHPNLGARVMRPELVSVDVHWHDYYELSLVLAGEAEHVVNGASRVIGPGSAFLLSPADFHAIRVTGPEPLRCYNTVIESAVVERQLAGIGAPAIGEFPWQVDDSMDIAPDLRRLRTELESPRLGSAQVADALVGCLVVELARRSGVAGPARARLSTSDDALLEAVLFVDRHFREQVSLSVVAARAHLSPNYFSERFRQVTGTSFQLYLQDKRLRFAKSLLATTSLSVSEICHAAGFGNLSHFGRAFRRRYGNAPSACRRVGNDT